MRRLYNWAWRKVAVWWLLRKPDDGFSMDEEPAVPEVLVREADRELYIHTVRRLALEQINKVRANMGLVELEEFPMGQISATACPVSRALGHDVLVFEGRVGTNNEVLATALEASGWEDYGPSADGPMARKHWRYLPESVRRFVLAFDNGMARDLYDYKGSKVQGPPMEVIH